MAQIVSGKEAREGLLSGINKLGNAVGSTLGPNGRTVIYQKGLDKEGRPYITKDGVTVAQNITSEDPLEFLAMELVKDVAKKTAILAGDGTTSSTVLIQELLNKSFELEVKSPRDFVQGMEAAEKQLKEGIDNLKKDLNPELLKYVATISANNSEEIGGVVADAFEAAGEYGMVTFKHNMHGYDINLEVKDGAVLDSGVLDNNFLTDTANRVVAQDNPLIFISTSKIDNIRQLESIIEHSIKEKRALTIISDAEVEVYQALAMNAKKNGMKINAIKPHGVTIFKRETLEDLAAVTGGMIHGDHLGDDARMITPQFLGTCKRLETHVNSTVFIFDERGPDTDKMAKQVEEMMKIEQDEGRINTLKERLANLKGRFAIINVGAGSPTEMNEKYDLVEDSVKAVYSAKKEGIVPGGGNALLYTSQNLKPLDGNKEFSKGFEAVKYAATRPHARILSNAFLEKQDVQSDGIHGVDGRTGDTVNLVEAGIVDPAFVVKQSIENAVSVAKTIIATDNVVLN